MDPQRHCTRCGTPIAGEMRGLCVPCLLAAGLEASAASAGSDITVDYAQPKRKEKPDSFLPELGEEFGGYRILRLLGRGGMGAVFEAEHIETGRRLALKVLSHSLDSAEARQRFLREGRLAAQVNHPNSVYIFSTEEIDGFPVITMELVRGGTLKDQLTAKGPLPVPDAVDAILQILAGLQAAQSFDVLHRDIKPSNCFVDADGTVKIGDFGLSISTVSRGEPHLTASGVFLGTPVFASPEQLRGDELDLRSDIYAVGVTLYMLLTGRVPFQSDNMVKLVAIVLEKPVPSPMLLRPDLPPGLAAVITRCLEKQPSQRYRTYGDLRAALLPYSSYVPTPAPLPLRFVAGLIDYVGQLALIAVPSFALSMMGVRWKLDAQDYFIDRMFETHVTPIPAGLWAWFAVQLSLWIGYYALPEAVWGRTLGKWICGMRVVDEHRQRPGFWKALARAAIFTLVPLFPSQLYLFVLPWPDGSDTRLLWMAVAGMTVYVFMALLFATARQRNGYAALHDLVTGTRVVLRPSVADRPGSVDDPATFGASAGSQRIGPYEILEPIQTTVDCEWYLGYDRRLLRKVWIRKLLGPGAEVPIAVRFLARAGRLRWLSGRRAEGDNWDAYEAPTGRALVQLIQTSPQPWAKVRFWIMDLAQELGTALGDGTLPDRLELERVWVTADGRAKLLDMPAPGLPAASGNGRMCPDKTDVAPTRLFLHDVAVASLNGLGTSKPNVCVPVALHARSFVEGLVHVQRPEVAAAQLQPLLHKSAEVTRLRRGMLLFLCFLVPAMLALLSGWQQMTLRAAKSLLPGVDDLQELIQQHSPVFNMILIPHANKADKPDIERYIAHRFRALVAEPDFWSNFYVQQHITPDQRRVVERICKETPEPNKEELERATEVAERLLVKRREAAFFFDMPIWLWMLLVFAGALLIFLPIPSLLCAVIFRGGLFWAIMGITAVNRRGEKASRPRVLWRQFAAWLPTLAAPFVFGILVPLLGLVWSVSVVTGIFLALVIGSLLLPVRGIPDRLAGTWLVRR